MTLEKLLEKKEIGPKGRTLVPFKDGEPLILGEPPENIVKVLILDCETTGLSYRNNEIIELAGVGVKACKDTGRIYAVGSLFDYFNQPVEPISDKITEITGITAEDVAGQSLDLTAIANWISKTDVILAHNATFDRPFVDSLPLYWDELAKPWGCSCHDPSWPKYGFSKRKLEVLLEEAGYEYSAHRAIYDCLATAFILALHPECMLEVLNKTLNETYKVTISKTPYGSNPLVQSKMYNYAGGSSWTKYYTDVDQMIEERQGIVDLMKTTFGKTPNVAVNHMDPANRFAAGY